MANPGYPPPPVTIDMSNMPDYVKFTLPTDQSRSDTEYMHGSGNSLDHYYAMRQAWIDSNIQFRASSADPYHYQSTPPPPLPVRTICDWSVDKAWFTHPADPDPSILPCTLPDYVAPGPSPSTGFPAGQAQKQDEIMLNALVQLLKDHADIKAALTQIESRLGIAIEATLAGK